MNKAFAKNKASTTNRQDGGQAAEYARSLIEASLDPLVTISPEGKITDVNEATVKVMGMQTYVLTVRDNGVGLPADLDWRRSKSLGLELVTDLTKQLDGTIEASSSAGTAFTITFKELQYEERG